MEPKKYPEFPVLVVDDEKNFLKSMDFELRSKGITNVECCQDSEQVIDRLKNSQYSVILLDLVMPGIDGIELLPVIVEEFPGIPVIILTGYPDKITPITCTKLGASGYLQKNNVTKELIETIRNALNIKVDDKIEEIDDVDYKTTIYFHLTPPIVFSSIEKEQEEEKKFLRSFFKCGSITIEIEENRSNQTKLELRGNEKLIFCYLAYKNYKALKTNEYPDWKSIPDTYEFRVSAEPDYNKEQKPEWDIFWEYICEKLKLKPIGQDIRQWKYSLDGVLKEKGIMNIIHTQRGRGIGYFLKGRVEFRSKA